MSSSPNARRWLPESRVLRIVGIVAGVLVLFILVLAFMDWNLLRGPIARSASAHLGRPVRIDGNLDVHLFSWTPSVSVSGLDIGNPKWAGPGPMARAERITIQVRLLPLFKGSVVLPLVRVEQPQVHLLRDAEGRVNWASTTAGAPAEAGKAPDLPVVQRFELHPGEITFKDMKRELDFKGRVAANETTDGNDLRPFRLNGSGRINGQAFRFDLRGARLVNVQRHKPYPFDVDLAAGKTHVVAHGTVPKPFDMGTVQSSFVVTGDDLADLFYITGLALPNTPPYRVAGRFARKGTQVLFNDLAGTVGDSDMSGDVSVELSGARPLLNAKVMSRSLDLDDVATWFGAAPSIKPGESVSPEQKAKGRAMAASERLFPDAQLKLARVRAMDADVQYEALAVRTERFPLQAISMHLVLNDGLLRFEPVSMVMPQGKIAGTVSLDARQDVAKTQIDAKLTGIRLSQFKSKRMTDAPFDGVLRGRVKLAGEGNSVHRFVSSTDGAATFVVPRGEVREALAELTGINVSRGLGLLLTQDEDKAMIRCGVADLKATDGTLEVKNMVFDTENVLITGRGHVGLESETFDLSIRGQPKKVRLLRLRSPIELRGPLRKPSVGLQASKAIGQSGVAAALGALVAPLAAVVAFVDPGLAKDADCAALLAEAKADGAPVKTAEILNAPRH